ncbi:MAG: hypothetical protein Fur0032_02300 [Terrimicrobiaceae bacterium]
MTPDTLRNVGLRCLPLPGFPMLPVGDFWWGKPGEIASVLMERLEKRSIEILKPATTRIGDAVKERDGFSRLAARQKGGQ